MATQKRKSTKRSSIKDDWQNVVADEKGDMHETTSKKGKAAKAARVKKAAKRKSKRKPTRSGGGSGVGLFGMKGNT